MYYTEDGIHLIDPMFVGPPERHAFLGIPPQFEQGTIDQINRSTFSFWRNQQVEEPDLQGILQKHYNRLESLDVSRRDTFESASNVAKIQALYNLTAASPHINRGAMVAAAWEKYVGTEPMDNIFSRKFIMDALGEDDEPEPIERPTLGLHPRCITGQHNWSDYEMVCNDCGVTMQELARG